MPRDTDDTTRVIERLRAEHEQLRRLSSRQELELQQVRRELRALGVQLPEITPDGHAKLSPQARLACARRAAAQARAAKTVGSGKSSVRTAEVAARMRSQVQQTRVIDEDESSS